MEKFMEQVYGLSSCLEQQEGVNEGSLERVEVGQIRAAVMQLNEII